MLAAREMPHFSQAVSRPYGFTQRSRWSRRHAALFRLYNIFGRFLNDEASFRCAMPAADFRRAAGANSVIPLVDKI